MESLINFRKIKNSLQQHLKTGADIQASLKFCTKNITQILQQFLPISLTHSNQQLTHTSCTKKLGKPTENGTKSLNNSTLEIIVILDGVKVHEV